MNLTYADSGLKTSLGHHAQSCRGIVPAMRAIGHEVAVLGPKTASDALSKELGVRPTFSRGPYDRANRDPIAGWLQDFLNGGVATADELQAAGVSRLYWNSAQPTQLHAVLIYLHRNPDARAVLEFGTGCGLVTEIAESGELQGRWPSPHEDATATLLRYCSYLIDDSVRPRLTLCTFDERASRLFEAVLDCPVQTFPVPRDAVGEPRLRGNWPGPLTISFLGHQRNGDKGYQFVPGIVRDVLERAKFADRPIRFLIHNGDPNGARVREIQQQVRHLAVEYPTQVIVDEREADAAIWQELLDASDLIVCPYWPQRFHASYSAVCCEAVANGIPLVVPVGTTLQETVRRYRGAPVLGSWEAEDVPTAAAKAVVETIKAFGPISEAACAGVAKWRAENGGARTAAAIAENLA